MKHVNEPTTVDAHFEADGKVRPHRFTWAQEWLDVTDVGRQWDEEDGHHVLVMVASRHTFELLLAQESLSWRVVRAPDSIATA